MVDIVVIDDDRLMLDQIVDTLQLEGFEAIGARFSRDGIKLVQNNLPRLIVCDVNMPDLDGFDVLTAIRSYPATAAIPFMFVTARAGRKSMRHGMDNGASDYLTKPFTAEELINAVHSLLRKHGALVNNYETTISILRRNITYALPHELRTPLMGSLGYAALLAESAGDFDAAQISSMAQEIVKSNQRLHRLIENYLVYAQLELNLGDPEQVVAYKNHITGKADLVIEEAAMDIASRVGRIDDLGLSLERIALPVAEENLRKIIAELAGNAFKFSALGNPVNIMGRRVDDSYVIHIADAGRGMDEEQLARIGAYMQFERAVYEQQGLGLGLVIAKRLIELHDGELAIRSQPDVGTEVAFRFPL